MFEQQKTHDKWEREKQKAPAAQAKFYGDVLKNVMPKFSSDMADTPVYFEGVEKIIFEFLSADGSLIKVVIAVLERQSEIFVIAIGYIETR
jgi:hypothetical protein